MIRAVNRQIEEDFAPYWSLGARLRLEGTTSAEPSHAFAEMRGDAVLYIWDHADIQGAIGYHDLHYRGIPYGFVFAEISKALGEAWSVTFSHEALEMVLDPCANLFAVGPHPINRRVAVFHWLEACDAVQAQTYLVDKVEVSNFLLPLYFTPKAEEGGRNDFLGRQPALRSFGIAPGGYVGFLDPRTGKTDTVEVDARATERQAIKNKMGLARRGNRYTDVVLS